jgi:hypothetical protein
MDHIDELMARREAVLRLRLHRWGTSNAARGCRLAATGIRLGQKSDLRRYLMWGAVAVCLDAIALELWTMARWGGHRRRYQEPARPRLTVPTPHDGHLRSFLASVRR